MNCRIDGCLAERFEASTMCLTHIVTGRRFVTRYLAERKTELFHERGTTNLYAIKGLDCVKFGIARSVKRRLRGLQVGYPHALRVHGVIEVAAHVELAVHDRCVNYWMSGEWFRWEGDVIRVADAIRQKDRDLLVSILSEPVVIHRASFPGERS